MISEILRYIEENLFDRIDYDVLSRKVGYNKYSVMRIFSASTGLGMAEYVRVRRLSEAGKRISETDERIIEVAFDCQYETAESFTKAFRKFNGFTPSECRKTKKFRYIPELIFDCVKNDINYSVVTFENTPFTGFATRFSGRSEDRSSQDENFFLSTRKQQEILKLIRSSDDVDWWEILDDFDEFGYNVSIAVIPDANCVNIKKLSEKSRSDLYDFHFEAKELCREMKRLNNYTVSGRYARFVSGNGKSPMDILGPFIKAVYAGIKDYPFIRDETRPELLKIHWCKRKNIDQRRLELYLPIK